MEGIAKDVSPLTRWANVVSKTTDRCWLAWHIELLPFSEEADEEIAFKLAMQHLWKEVKVAYEGCLQDDGNVAGVEEFDGVGESLATLALAVEL